VSLLIGMAIGFIAQIAWMEFVEVRGWHWSLKGLGVPMVGAITYAFHWAVLS